MWSPIYIGKDAAREKVCAVATLMYVQVVLMTQQGEWIDVLINASQTHARTHAQYGLSAALPVSAPF